MLRIKIFNYSGVGEFKVFLKQELDSPASYQRIGDIDYPRIEEFGK